MIKEGDFDGVEALWMEEIEKDPSRFDLFLETGRKLRKAGERSMSDTLLELLAESQKEKGLWFERLQTLKENARLSKKPAAMKDEIVEALEKALGERKSYQTVLDVVGIDPEDPAGSARKIETWLKYEEGEPFFMAGRGVGVISEMNPQLGVARVDFPKEKRFPVPLGAAPKFLEDLGRDHILRSSVEDPDSVRERALEDPGAFLGRLLSDFGRPMLQSEIRDAMAAILPDGKWNSWWNSARKNPQVVMSGKGVKATYTWSASSEAADDAIIGKFRKAKLEAKRKIAKRESGRSQELADLFAQELADAASKIAESDPSTAWETFAMLDKLPGNYQTDVDRDALLLESNTSRVISDIGDRQTREQAIRRLTEIDEGASRTLEEIFFNERDSRTLTMIYDLLVEIGAEEVRSRLVEQTLRYPRRHPRVFMWYAKRADKRAELPPRADYALIYQLNELLSSDISTPERAAVKEMFDKGRLVLRIIAEVDDREEAQKLFNSLDRLGQLEPYRRDYIKAAIEMKYASIREEEGAEPILALAETIEKKREELAHLKKVEIPENLRALQEAREMGDLRENFEYKSARQRQEYLSARVAALTGELERVLVIDPDEVDDSTVKPGTTVVLEGDQGPKTVTILGAWESDPENDIYSNESEAAKALIGKKRGDEVEALGANWRVGSIAPYDRTSE